MRNIKGNLIKQRTKNTDTAVVRGNKLYKKRGDEGRR